MTATTDAKPHTTIKSLTDGMRVDGVYSLINPQLGMTRAGKHYLKCILRDASGEVVCRMWSFEEADFPSVASTGFVWIEGHTQLYNGQVQLIVEHIKSVEVSIDEMQALMPTTTRDIDEMLGEMRAVLDTLVHPAMKALAEAYLADESRMELFKHAPAGMSLHHAWIGGLLEHTLQLLKLAEQMLPMYPELNRDIVLMGLFLHDFAKTEELTWDKGFAYTTDGNLVGHIVRGAIVLQFKAAQAAKASGERLPAAALRVLQHIIISHHGQPEHGAAKIPSTPEAIFVSMLDDLDAKTAMAISAVQRDGETAGPGEFTDRIWALNTRLYRPDPLAE